MDEYESKGHIAFLAGGREAFERGGDVFISLAKNPLDVHGYRMGARFECSRMLWDHYIKAFNVPGGQWEHEIAALVLEAGRSKRKA